MKTKKILFIILLICMCINIYSIQIKADDLKPLLNVDGEYIYYANTDQHVMIPQNYIQKDRYFRAVWVTPLAGCLPTFTNIEGYKQEINEMLDVMEYYNLNAVVFHIRIFNDALYLSDLNPTSPYMNTNWDSLAWTIEECHKRGIEFHAWLNPYRIKSSNGTNPTEEAERIKSNQPNNIGSDPNNILVSEGGWVMLNPGLPEVRDFLVETVKEIMTKYDVDAIHFDDYFYVSGINDDNTYNQYNPNNLSKDDWRREQINIFMRNLRSMMLDFNKNNNRYVQLGISPTGIYRNGDGVVTYSEDGTAITNGSNTGGQEHYQSHLFCDTKKWVDEEIIDYICPQSYWGFTHPIAGYADVMDWWNAIVKNKKVNLYSGMGIYMSENPGSNYSWGSDYEESYKQILYCTKLDKVKGTVFYNYNYLENAYKGDSTSLYGRGLAKIKEELFTIPAILPEINTTQPIILDDVTNLSVLEKDGNNEISFNNVKDAKAYVIYRFKDKIDFSSSDVIKIIWANEEEQIQFIDQNVLEKYNYGVRVLSNTNSLSKGVKFDLIKYNIVFKDSLGTTIETKEAVYGESLDNIVKVPEVNNKKTVGWSYDLSFITNDLVVYPKYEDSDFIVRFYNFNKELVKEVKTNYLGSVLPITLDEVEGYIFSGYDKELSNIKHDLDVYPLYEKKSFTVEFIDDDGTSLSVQKVKYLESAYLPATPTKKGYIFDGWDIDYTVIKADTTIKAVYKQKTFTVTFKNGYDGSIIEVRQVPQFTGTTYPEVPEIPGYKLDYWRGGSIDRIICDITITAEYSEVSYFAIYYDYDGNIYKEDEVFYGDTYSIPEGPVKEGYIFKGWDKELDIVKGDLEIHPLFEIVDIQYFTVRYIGFNDIVLMEEKVAKGNNATFDLTVPNIEGYTFTKWDNNGISINGNVDIKALFEIITYTISYVDYDNNILKSESIKYNQNASFNIQPPKKEGYTFVNWDNDGKNIKNDLVIKAIYKINTYTVSFVDFNGNVIKTIEVNHNDIVPLDIEIPNIDKYTFIGFDYNDEPITEDISIKLLYEKKKSGCNLFSIIEIITSLVIVYLVTKKKK